MKLQIMFAVQTLKLIANLLKMFYVVMLMNKNAMENVLMQIWIVANLALNIVNIKTWLVLIIVAVK